jgi:hypothetical protein
VSVTGQLNLFKSRRQRGTQPPPPKEFALHCVVADTVRRWILPGWIWTHFPAGEARPHEIVGGKRISMTGARLRRMGLNPGFPDFQFFHAQGRCAFLELKRHGEVGTEEQDSIGAHLKNAGHDYLLTDKIEEAIASLVAWGVLRSIKVQ